MRFARLCAPFAAVLFASSAANAADPDPWFGKDKALHFTISAAISGGAYALTALATDKTAIRVAVGAGTGVTVGGAKELYDLSGHGDPSWKDFAWDVAGTAVGVGIAVSIDFLTRSREPVKVTRAAILF